jgi:hypothetical protein
VFFDADDLETVVDNQKPAVFSKWVSRGGSPYREIRIYLARGAIKPDPSRRTARGVVAEDPPYPLSKKRGTAHTLLPIKPFTEVRAAANWRVSLLEVRKMLNGLETMIIQFQANS